MSKREDITETVVKVLKNSRDPAFGLVTREHFDVTKLSRMQFPALYLSTADETRVDESMTGSGMTRSSILNLQLAGFVNGKNIDTLRNDLVERVEEELEKDRKLGGLAKFVRVNDVTVDFDQPDYIGRVDILLEVYYTYNRGRT